MGNDASRAFVECRVDFAVLGHVPSFQKALRYRGTQATERHPERNLVNDPGIFGVIRQRTQSVVLREAIYKRRIDFFSFGARAAHTQPPAYEQAPYEVQ